MQARWTFVVAAAIVALSVSLAYPGPPSSGPRPTVGQVLSTPRSVLSELTPTIMSYSVCTSRGIFACVLHPAESQVPPGLYAEIVIEHGPAGDVGAVNDSLNDTFDNLSWCWLHNDVFGHTEILLATVWVTDPAAYALTFLPNGDRVEFWAEVVLLSEPMGGVVLSVESNTCAEHPVPSNSTVNATFQGSGLGLFLWDFVNRTAISCASGSAVLLGPCGTNVSGPFNRGLSSPAVAFEEFRAGGTHTATVSFRGGDCANDVLDDDGCPVMDAVLSVST